MDRLLEGYCPNGAVLCCAEYTLLDGFGTILQLGVVSASAPMPKSPFASEDSNKTKRPKKLRKERKEVWKEEEKKKKLYME